MSYKPVTQEELELAMQSFEQMGGMTKYAQMIKDAMEALRQNFDAIESALRMTQTLHDKQLQGIDHWISICKFLVPIFATAAVAGLTIDTEAIPLRSELATLIGSIGFLVFLLVCSGCLINDKSYSINKRKISKSCTRHLSKVKRW